MMRMKSILRPLVPEWAKNAHARYLSRKMDSECEGLSVKQVFERAYATHLWGRPPDQSLYSGKGSHSPGIVTPYVEAVRQFIISLPQRPTVVDLGCGDFNVGRQLYDLCSAYTACDIVGPVVEQNRKVYAALPVRFLELDMIEEPLPAGDIACIRQVLQHLSNEQIGRIVPKLQQYRYLIITEHLPGRAAFRSNAEKPAGPGTRIGLHSGVVLTDAPFFLIPRSQRTICSQPQVGGLIQTIVYEL